MPSDSPPSPLAHGAINWEQYYPNNNAQQRSPSLEDETLRPVHQMRRPALDLTVDVSTLQPGSTTLIANTSDEGSKPSSITRDSMKLDIMSPTSILNGYARHDESPVTPFTPASLEHTLMPGDVDLTMHRPNSKGVSNSHRSSIWQPNRGKHYKYTVHFPAINKDPQNKYRLHTVKHFLII